MSEKESSKERKSAMPVFWRIVVIAVLIVVVAAVLIFKFAESDQAIEQQSVNSSSNIVAQVNEPVEEPHPILVDLGSDKCIPCQMMEPVLEELRKEYEGKLDVVFINIRTDYEEAEKYSIQVIPTQIFYSPAGDELFRHVGFFSKEDILKTWKELGFDFE